MGTWFWFEIFIEKKYAITITDAPHWVHTYLANTRCSSNFCVWPLPISEISEVNIGCKNIGIITSSRRIYNQKKIEHNTNLVETLHWIRVTGHSYISLETNKTFTSYGQSYIKLRAKMHEKSRYSCYRWKNLDHFQQLQFSLTFIIAHHLRSVVIQRGIWCGKKWIFFFIFFIEMKTIPFLLRNECTFCTYPWPNRNWHRKHGDIWCQKQYYYL